MALGSKRTFKKILKYIKKCKPNLQHVFAKPISLPRIYNDFKFYKIKSKNLFKKKNLQKIDPSTKNI